MYVSKLGLRAFDLVLAPGTHPQFLTSMFSMTNPSSASVSFCPGPNTWMHLFTKDVFSCAEFCWPSTVNPCGNKHAWRAWDTIKQNIDQRGWRLVLALVECNARTRLALYIRARSFFIVCSAFCKKTACRCRRFVITRACFSLRIEESARTQGVLDADG